MFPSHRYTSAYVWSRLFVSFLDHDTIVIIIYTYQSSTIQFSSDIFQTILHIESASFQLSD
jgi:hypothetical protein